MQPEQAKSKVELRPWEYADFAIAWDWINSAWGVLADDTMPRDIDSYVELKRRQFANHFGVYVDDRLCGLISQTTITPWLCDADCVFRIEEREDESKRRRRRLLLKPEETQRALEAGMRIAWGWGFHKIRCRVFPENRAMTALLRRLGAVFEGRHFHETQRGGRWTDMLYYALIRED